jgi:plastocyanin
MRPARACCAILAGAWVIGGSVSAVSATLASKVYVVTIENMQFNPQKLTVRVGDRVQWVNKDLVPHTATADVKAFDSRSIAPNASWNFVAHHAGEYGYDCIFHPTMKGTLTVVP